MAASKLSQSTALRIAANVFGTIFVGFGVNAIIRPHHALTFFEFVPPADTLWDKALVDSLMIIHGARNVFMGIAIYIASAFAGRKGLGWMLIVASAIAFADGAVCRLNGKGEWGHWGYAPFITAVGALLLGTLDGAGNGGSH